MINIKINTIEEKVLDKIVDIYIERSEKKSLNKIKFSKKDILERSDLNDVQVKNALVRLSYKGFIFNYRYKEYNLYDDKLELIETEITKRKLQNGIF